MTVQSDVLPKLIELEQIVVGGTSTADTVSKLGSSDVFKELVVHRI